MKYHAFLKAVAIFLASCGLVVALGSGCGIAVMAEQGLYSEDYQTWQEQLYWENAHSLAVCMAESYAARNLSDLTRNELRWIGWGNSPETIGDWRNIDAEDWCYTISDSGGNVLESNYSGSFANAVGFSETMSVRYPVSSTPEEDWEHRVSYQQAYWEEDPDWQEGDTTGYLYIKYVESPQYTVSVWIAPSAIDDFSGVSLEGLEFLVNFRYYFIGFAVGGLLLTVVCLVYLCCAAGKSRKSADIKPGGLNRLPLDIYVAGAGVTGFYMVWVVAKALENMLYSAGGLRLGWLALAAPAALVAALCIVGVVFALAAQWKMGNFYVWKHSVIGGLCGKLWKLLLRCGNVLCKLYHMMPLIWRYLLIAFAMAAVPAFCLLMCIVANNWGRGFWMMVLLMAAAADIAVICYGAYAYGTVLEGARTMAQGDLHTGIDTARLYGSYKDCAQNLNTLADVAVVAAKKQMRSERMKTELITNVSHDIKTPLTSVINYIDLLQKAKSQEESARYLEVLDRQAHKLKKLIDDLMEMSKATTGDMAVDITRLDAVEAVTQALGEFSDKLEEQSLSVVLRKPDQPALVRADGRLTWRVLSNLMGNIVKYALPGTRVYVQVEQLEGQVRISLKNISREELNISADELTERFVRGDASRNTEGSGLGLNIAKSFMQLQGGQLELLVDGDLFKVTLIFQAG